MAIIGAQVKAGAPFLCPGAGSFVEFAGAGGAYLSSRSTTLTTMVKPMLRRMQVARGMNTWCSPMWNDRSPGRRPRSGIRGEKATRMPTISTTRPMMTSALPISCEGIASIVAHVGGLSSPRYAGCSGPSSASAPGRAWTGTVDVPSEAGYLISKLISSW